MYTGGTLADDDWDERLNNSDNAQRYKTYVQYGPRKFSK